MPPAPLLLIPTVRERDLLLRSLELAEDVEIEVIGFGPVAAAASGARLFHARPGLERAVLAGIAGRYPEGPAVGDAIEFGAVRLDGVGALGPDGLLTPAAMGLPQWTPPGGEPVFDALPLAGEGPELLTVCAAAGSPDDVTARVARAPESAAEDMEAFAVALAARAAGVELRVVRGISNEAGDRNHARWRIDDALAAVAGLAADALT